MKKLSHVAFILSLTVLFVSCSRGERVVPKAAASASAPSLALTDLQGKKVELNNFKGKVVMIEFFASWCAPCQMVAPELQDIYKKYKDKGLVVLAVSIDEGREALPALKSFVKEYGVSYAVLMDDGNASSRYGVMSIPTSFIIDRQGKIRNKHQGYIPEMSKELSKEIETLL